MPDGGDSGSVNLGGLEPDALRVLDFLADRLRLGRKAYGDLVIATDRRSARKERGEEIADLLVYTAIGVLKGELDAEQQLAIVQAKCTALLVENRRLREEIQTLTEIIDALEHDATLPGWKCPNCQAFNGDAKEHLPACRACEAPRPALAKCAATATTGGGT